MTDHSSGWGTVTVTVGFLVIMLALSGCEFRRIAINDPIRTDDVAFIVPGHTTRSEVVAKLGAPDEIAGSDEQAVFRYRFRVAKIFRVDFSWILLIWSPVTPDLVLAHGDLGTDVLQVVFNSNWVVQEHAFANQSPAARFNPWPF